MASCIVLGCSTGNNGGKQFTLDGVWTLRQMDYPAGGTKTFEETKETLLRLYEGDSVFHQCWMTRTETGLTISPPKPPVMLFRGGGTAYDLFDGHLPILFRMFKEPHDIDVVYEHDPDDGRQA